MRTHIGFSAGVNRYQEPGLMQLLGAEMGLHPRITGWHAMPQAQLEGDVFLGKQRYTSTESGSINGVTNIETRWRGLLPLFGSTSPQVGFSSGVAVHTLWNDLRGRSSTGAGGYERSAVQLWLPVRWASGDVWELDAGLLMYGRHSSKLSEASKGYDDIVNTQHRGQYAQVSMKVPSSNGDGSLKPFVRYTHLADSNEAVMGGKYWVEPESQRWQIGAVWEFNTP
ncbi:hypothetical protein [Limnohabitans sp.]|uniref:hypothetical protein n=1 Tax=Limnohabitans sp. TaxID=1907725 RepID=UPI00286EBEA2|nr:hypothetical protein [Limnohabitans sp.]